MVSASSSLQDPNAIRHAKINVEGSMLHSETLPFISEMSLSE